jgi:hypothetical protein
MAQIRGDLGLDLKHTKGFVEVVEAPKVKGRYELKHLEALVKAAKALGLEEITVGIDKRGLLLLMITERVGIAVAPTF